jgi:hypothetical protein
MLAAREGIALPTTALSAITSTPMTSKGTTTTMREGDRHYYYPMQQCSQSEESSPKVDKKTFFQLGISTVSQFLLPIKIFDLRKRFLTQKVQNSFLR